MKRFAQLFEALDYTTKTNERINALVGYFNEADDEDKLWTIALLAGKRPKRQVNSTKMKEWIADLAGIPMWVFEESYQVVGDMSETISLLLPDKPTSSDKKLTTWMNEIGELKDKEDSEKETYLKNAWSELNRRERFVLNKLIGGSFRVGISQKNMVKALSKYSGKDENVLAHRLMGNWSPNTHTYSELIMSEASEDEDSKPYPFYLAYALDEKSDFDGDPKNWFAEHKWNGIRGQLIKRGGEIYVWSRGEELVTDKYPELRELKSALFDGTVIDGEILPFKDGKPLTFNDLQKRIGRKNVGKKLLADVPVVLFAYDLLEFEGKDLRNLKLENRREKLEEVIEEANHSKLRISKLVNFQSIDDLRKERQNARANNSEGLMLKRKDATYKVGRKRGDWWKWKVDPLVIDAVMIYAMRGSGRRSNLYTDYTFAVWHGKELVPFTKAYSGLTDDEFHQVDRFVKNNIIEKFGPVRSVKPELVFEIAFEGINESTRHKSGIALRFPRMSRWRKDNKPEEANTLDDLKEMLDVYK